jgi:hypothetical protein
MIGAAAEELPAVAGQLAAPDFLQSPSSCWHITARQSAHSMLSSAGRSTSPKTVHNGSTQCISHCYAAARRTISCALSRCGTAGAVVLQRLVNGQHHTGKDNGTVPCCGTKLPYGYPWLALVNMPSHRVSFY